MPPYLIEVNLPGREYRVHIEEGVLDRLGALMSGLFAARRALLVSDTRVYRLYGYRCLSSLEKSGWQVATALVRPGERSKSLNAAAGLYAAASQAGLERGTPLVALGGGVVGDLAGFVASTYLRGVPLVAVPTTLIAQADSSVGGKTALNLPRGKNLVGTFYQPRLVAADPAVLATLPPRQLRAGAAEVAKYGAAADPPFFYWLEENLERFRRRDPGVLAEAVARSMRAKAAVVERDEREQDYRRLLNFGHSFGHALEAATGYRYYLHGEAVLAGMIAATELACRLSLLQPGPAERITALLSRIGVKPAPPGLEVKPVLEALAFDKKRRRGELVFVLPVAVGAACFHPCTDEALLRETIGLYLAGKEPFHLLQRGREK